MHYFLSEHLIHFTIYEWICKIVLEPDIVLYSNSTTQNIIVSFLFKVAFIEQIRKVLFIAWGVLQ